MDSDHIMWNETGMRTEKNYMIYITANCVCKLRRGAEANHFRHKNCTRGTVTSEIGHSTSDILDILQSFQDFLWIICIYVKHTLHFLYPWRNHQRKNKWIFSMNFWCSDVSYPCITLHYKRYFNILVILVMGLLPMILLSILNWLIYRAISKAR